MRCGVNTTPPAPGDDFAASATTSSIGDPETRLHHRNASPPACVGPACTETPRESGNVTIPATGTDNSDAPATTTEVPHDTMPRPGDVVPAP
jgi:hypothetical protein